MTLTPGMRLGPYEIQAAIGAGGMGEVYLAHDTRLNRKVALKSLSDPSLDAPEARDRLLREARAAAQLTHPNIAATYDILDSGPRPCIVMEYVQGEPLAAKIQRGPMPSAQAVAVGIQLADALAHAHAAGVVHRDLKPANVQVTPDGTVKVLDFGLAQTRALEQPDLAPAAPARDVAQSQAGRLMGTPAYMAPEQLMGHAATPLSDVYGLGVVLFELLTGRRPFEAPDFVNLALAILSDPTPAARAVNAAVPQEVSAIVARAMARKPADRYPSAAAMAADLRRAAQALSDQPTGVVRPSDPGADLLRLVRRRMGRRRLRAVVGTIVVASALAVSIVAIWKSRERQAPSGRRGTPVLAVLPLANLSGDAAKDYVGVGVAEALTTALAGTPSLTVISRNDSGKYLARAEDAAKIARDLGATLLVSGAVLEAGDSLRFTVKVVRPDSTVMWARTYDSPLADLFPLQGRMADDVATALGLPMTPADRARFSRSQAASVDAYTDYSMGRTLLDREDLAGNAVRAVAAFERAVKKDSRFVLAYVGLGDACWAQYHATNDSTWVTRATAAIQQAQRLDPGDPEVRVALASVYLETGKNSEAMDELRQALARRPNDDQAHRLLARALVGAGRPDEALGEFQQAIATRPNYFRNHSALGVFYFHAGRYAEAAIAFQRVTEIQPDSTWGFINLGAAYFKSGDNRRALENFQRALAIGPDEAAYSNVGTIQYAEGRFQEAAHAFEQAIQLGPNNHTSRRNLGDAYLRIGLQDKARAEYERAAAITLDLLKVNPLDAQTLACHALYDAKVGRKADAIRQAEEAVIRRPDDVDVLFKRAAVYALAGRSAEAIPALERAIAKGYSRAQARADDDLISIRQEPRVAALLREPR